MSTGTIPLLTCSQNTHLSTHLFLSMYLFTLVNSPVQDNVDHGSEFVFILLHYNVFINNMPLEHSCLVTMDKSDIWKGSWLCCRSGNYSNEIEILSHTVLLSDVLYCICEVIQRMKVTLTLSSFCRPRIFKYI